MNYLEEQTDEEAMINSIKNGDQPLPRVTQVSIAGTTSTEKPPLKDKSMWKDAVLYEYETFKATEGELLLDTYIRYLQVINDLKKCGYSKDNRELNFKLLNNLQPEWKQYATMMRQNKNLMDINIDALYNILKQNQGDVNDVMGSKKKTVVVTSDPLALIAEKTNVSRSKEKDVVSLKSEGSEADDFNDKKVKKKADEKKRDISRVKCYNCKKEGHFANDCKKAKMESSNDSDQEINANMVFMAQIEKVLSDAEASSSSADEKISENYNLMDINIDALYNILKQNQGDVNDAIGLKKKTVVVTSDPLALIAEKTNVSKSKEKVVVSSDSEGSEADDSSELKKITALLVKAFNRRKFYSKATNNNIRTSSSSQSANKKQEFVKIDNKRVEKKDDEKKRDMSRTKMLLAKKDTDEQVLLAEDQAWMESSSDSDQEINANMVFIAQIEKVLSDSEASSSSADEKISEVSCYLSESESESEFETSEYYDNSTNYGLFMNNDDDQEIFHDAIESASENFI
nr:hypothetical protein [Tanacetum cinerariifolium]